MELTKEMIDTEVDKRKEEILQFVSKLVQQESVTYSKNMPNVMKWLVDKGKADGFEGEVIEPFKNDQGHPIGITAWSHFGNKEKWVGSMCHIDTVPYLENEWTFAPLSGEIRNGKLYGRGTQDMKGSTVAVYTAMKLFKELGVKLSKGIKIIYGSQEEVGDWSEMEHALQVLGTPETLFTAEGGWPVVNAERGVVFLEVNGKLQNHSGWSAKGGKMYNGVCSKVTLKVDNKTKVFYGSTIHTAKTLVEKADSAIPKAMKWLEENGYGNALSSYLLKFWNNNRFADNTPLAYETNEMGKNLVNQSKLDVKADGAFTVSFDIRFPVHPKYGNAKYKNDALTKHFNDNGLENAKGKTVMTLPAYYIDPQNPIVKVPLETYWEWTGTDKDSAPMINQAGGTYAKLRNHAAAFGGVNLVGSLTRAHMADEWLDIKDYMTTVKIMVHTLYKLAK